MTGDAKIPPPHTDQGLDRRAAVARLLQDRGDLLVISGLGSPTWDLFAAGDHERNFYLWAAMGSAAMMGLGLALARPRETVLVLTGDGEMLMGLGSLATIGVKGPGNLAVVVLDNGIYGETGGQASHTAGGVALHQVAGACGLETMDIADQMGIDTLRQRVHEKSPRPLFATLRISRHLPPKALPSHDGPLLNRRFRAVLAS